MKSNCESEITLIKLFLGTIYLTICSLIFLLLAGMLIDFIFDGEISLKGEWLFNILAGSIIIGISGSLGSWIFAKIDERKTRKSPPSDPD
ncbi:hypothetical protein BTJ39_23960 [Izhakiella australiensis]|uniref:Uncharacterized protein n=1 Tax=Izhakiella australiensis TaxID=1926881 RepID=A0A1S8Y3X1_9GAMM|nr:hypothetical protein [Izhakiella australiensis]OON33562.1 hypothetical protein BTJ39_23960 [Izhakiella australiensis]